MKKYVLANQGRANQGKSKSIINITEALVKMYPNYSRKDGQLDYSQDIYIILEINNHLIGIESQGDPNSRLKSSLIKFVNEKCDIIICATRTCGETVNAVNKLKNDDYNIIFFTNYRSEMVDHNILNQFTASDIINFIDKIMSNKL